MKMPRFLADLKPRLYVVYLLSTVLLAASLLLRLGLLVWSSKEVLSEPLGLVYALASGLIYDVVFCLYAMIPLVAIVLLLPERVHRSTAWKWLQRAILFGACYGIVFVCVAELVFWDEFKVRFNFIAVDYLVYTQEVLANIWESYPIVWILLGVCIPAGAAAWQLSKRVEAQPHAACPLSARGIGILVYAALIGLIIGFVDQGLRSHTRNNYITELASNGPYQFFAAFRNNEINYKVFYAQGEDQALSDALKRHYRKDPADGGLYDISRKELPAAASKKPNVILISVESLSGDYFTRFGNKENITPFMDEWFNEGIFFSNFYATGTRTTRGLEAITLSVPPTPGRSIVKRPDNAGYYNIGGVLKENGYDAVYLYGGRGYFDNMNGFFKGCGYRIVDQGNAGKEDITFENAWGMCDEDLYGMAIREADRDFEAKKPFYFHVMTTSNHRPYTFPEGRINLTSGKAGRLGGVKYTDYSLKRLIEVAKTKPWFDNTIFVVVADHCASSAGKTALPIEKYHIPCFIYQPSKIKPADITKTASQIDIAPTLLKLMGISYTNHFFGEDILSENFHERAFIGTYQKLGYYRNDELVVLNPQQKIQIVKDPWHNKQDAMKGDMTDPLVHEALGFYQAADYVIQNRLNRH